MDKPVIVQGNCEMSMMQHLVVESFNCSILYSPALNGTAVCSPSDHVNIFRSVGTQTEYKMQIQVFYQTLYMKHSA